MSKLIDDITETIRDMVDGGEDMSEASWGMEQGVLLTGNQVRELLADLEVSETRLDEAHKVLATIYGSGIDLQGHENTVSATLFRRKR